MATTQASTETIHVETTVPSWWEYQGPEARGFWYDEIVPALERARAASPRRRQAALDDAASVVAECVERVGGLDAWHAGLLLGSCADIAGVGLPLDPSDVFDPDRDADVFEPADWM